MEFDETPAQPPAAEPQPQFILNDQALYYLHKAGQWANFIGIVGFVMTGLIVILALL